MGFGVGKNKQSRKDGGVYSPKLKEEKKKNTDKIDN